MNEERRYGSSGTGPVDARHSAQSFRSLVWRGSVPVCVSLAENEVGGSSDRLTDCYYLQAPRTSYLPLLLPDIRKHLVDLVLHDAQHATLKPEHCWFDCKGEPVRWHWPMGLLFDFYLGYFVSSPKDQPLPLLHLTMHLSNPPVDKLLLQGPSLDGCRTNFMNMVKQSDYVRWGNTRRVTSLRKVDQDALWEGVLQEKRSGAGDFDRYWSVASKLMPPPQLAAPSVLERTYSNMSQSSTMTETGTTSKDATGLKSVPMRLHLADVQASALQDVIVPLSTDGTPTTLHAVLSSQIPLLFPPQRPASPSRPPLARAILHGVRLPLDSEVSFLASTMSGADGWLQIVIKADPVKS